MRAKQTAEAPPIVIARVNVMETGPSSGAMRYFGRVRMNIRGALVSAAS
jgi:hypothetical protein